MPDLLSNTQWLYADIFLPIFLPTLDLNNNARPLSSARTFMDILNNNNNNTSNQTTLVPALDYVDIELFSSNQTLSNATNSTVSIREKRSVDSTATRPSPVAVLTTRIAQILQAINTTTNSTERSGRVEFDLANYPAISSLLGGSLAGGASNFNSNLIAGLLKTTPSVQAAKTTTAKAAAAAVASSGSSVDINPFSLYDLITSINSGNALTSTTGLLQMITPLFALLPLDQLFPQNTKEQNLAIVSTLPEVIKIIQFFNTFQVLSIEVK